MTNLINRDEETGLVVKKNYLCGSGFTAVEGFRQFGNLTIREGVLKGTASCFLTNVRVFDQNNIMILDITFDKLTSYSRERVRKVVLNELVQMLLEVAAIHGKQIDAQDAWERLDRDLKAVYFKESYAALLKLAEEWGICIN